MIMVSEKEYFLLSFLSYCNFTKKHYHKNLYEVWSENKDFNLCQSSFITLQLKFQSLFLQFFEKELKEWHIVFHDNRRARKLSSSQSGFYAICFQNQQEEYVLAFRGSEINPIEDAYQDFISTDLAIGMGKIPVQFHEGVEVYEKLIQHFHLQPSQLSLTGHSLGGGIAQYVALSIDRLHQYVPITYTWNAVGVNKKGIVHIGEFINLQEILEKIPELSQEQRSSLLAFREEYQEFFSQEYEKTKGLSEKKIKLDSAFFKRLYSQTKIEQYLKYLSLSQREKLLEQSDFWNKLFDLQNFYQKIKDGETFIQKINKKEAYQERIINYGHSSDLTHSLFLHIGKQCFIDKNSKLSGKKKESFLDRIPLLKKSFISYHAEVVFLPFWGNGENSQSLTKELSSSYIASVLRKILQKESLFKPDFLASYYARETLTEKNYIKYKQELIQALKKSSKILYCKEIQKQLESYSYEEFQLLWEEMQNRMASPYRYQDLFDVLAYEYC